MATSPNLDLPLIEAAQAQKHVTHNEALRMLDAVVQLAVISRMVTAPPGSPAEGDRYIVPTGATGAWASAVGQVAVWQAGAWILLAPGTGWRAYVVAEFVDVVFNGTDWLDPSDLPGNFATLGVNATADLTTRFAVAAASTLFDHVGNGHQVKVNKAASGDTASLLFQTGFSGRAEIGTAGSNDFEIKTSANGSAWQTALRAAATGGRVTLPSGVAVPAGAAATPGLNLDGDADSGMFSPGADQIGWATGGTQRLLLSTTALTSALPVLLPLGTAAAPGITFTSDTNTGMFSPGADQIGWATGGTQRLLLSTTALTPTVPVLASSGSATAPSMSFSGDTNTGMFSLGADVIGFATNGAERMRVNNNGLQIGDPVANGVFGLMRVAGPSSGGAATVHVSAYGADAGGPALRLGKSRSAALGGVDIVQPNDVLGSINFLGADGSTINNLGADIVSVVTGTPATADIRSNIRLRTRGDTGVQDRLVASDVQVAVTGRLTVNSAVANAVQVTVADDAVTTFTPARTGGYLLMTAGGNVGGTITSEPHSATVFFDVGTTAAFCAKDTGIAGVAGNVDCVTGTTLTGTTGTDGNVTVSARTDGTLMLENRSGSSRTFTLWVL